MKETNKNHPFEELNEEQKAISIPYFVHEGEMYRVERLNKRWFVSFLIVLFMLFASNIGWVIYESTVDTYSYEQEAHSEASYAIALLNTGEGSMNYNGNSVEATNEPGQENLQQASAETMP